jgi:methionine sulfoxide reductase heme-binding subunit
MNLVLRMPAVRQKRHITLAFIAMGSVVMLFVLFGFSRERWVDTDSLKAEMIEWRISMALAYTALSFLAVTLGIGPLNVLRRRPLSTNNYLRRDVGIWSGILALSHVVFGITIHTDGLNIWTLWVMDMAMPGYAIPLQQGWFGIANFAGIFQATLILLILVISNDVMILRLGLGRWKRLQRLSYAALLLILIHGFAYQRVENRDGLLRIVFLVLIGSAAMIQIAGFVTVMRKYKRQKQDVMSQSHLPSV